MYKDCDVGLEQTLPSGVYAGEDEMKEYCCKNSVSPSSEIITYNVESLNLIMLRQEKNLFNNIFSYLKNIYLNLFQIKTVFITPVDIEMNAKDSTPIVIQIFSKVKNSKSVFSIPVHARYHEAVRGGG